MAFGGAGEPWEGMLIGVDASPPSESGVAASSAALSSAAARAAEIGGECAPVLSCAPVRISTGATSVPGVARAARRAEVRPSDGGTAGVSVSAAPASPGAADEKLSRPCELLPRGPVAVGAAALAALRRAAHHLSEAAQHLDLALQAGSPPMLLCSLACRPPSLGRRPTRTGATCAQPPRKAAAVAVRNCPIKFRDSRSPGQIRGRPPPDPHNPLGRRIVPRRGAPSGGTHSGVCAE